MVSLDIYYHNDIPVVVGLSVISGNGRNFRWAGNKGSHISGTSPKVYIVKIIYMLKSMLIDKECSSWHLLNTQPPYKSAPMLENSCQLTWILSWNLLSNSGPRTSIQQAVSHLIIRSYHKVEELKFCCWNERIALKVEDTWAFLFPRHLEISEWLDDPKPISRGFEN